MTDPAAEATKLIGQGFLEEGLLTPKQLEQLLAGSKKDKQRLGEAAVGLGFLTEEQHAQFLAKFFHLTYVDLPAHQGLAVSAVDLIPEAMARRYQLIAIEKEGDLLTVAMADPLDVRAMDAVRLETNHRIRRVVSGLSDILRAIDQSYLASSRIAKTIDLLLEEEASPKPSGLSSDAHAQVDQLKHEASDAPVVQFVNLILMRAVRDRASDIHIEPEETSIAIRLRVDGQLHEVTAPPRHMFHAIINRIKLLGNLDIAERRLPQDGHFKFKVFDKTIDVRLSCLPTVYGEKLVLRILDRSNLILDLQVLGFEPAMLEAFQQVLKLPHGLVILTGPTGSGKTTTLYTALNTIKTRTKNIVTIEDPVEYQISKIVQVQAKPDIGLTFAAGLRSILRQDPDIIMVGEIRDRETAEICIRSALTGHLVLSTLHTNDAVSAISRLTDMGLEPYLLTATLSLVMAQRLVRRICEDCAAPWQPPAELLARLKKLSASDKSSWKFLKGKGCPRCLGTGYLGRVAIYEQFILTEKIKNLLAEGAKLHQVRRQAQEEGLQSLLQSALHKVQAGVTTLEEALSVCATQAEMEDV